MRLQEVHTNRYFTTMYNIEQTVSFFLPLCRLLRGVVLLFLLTLTPLLFAEEHLQDSTGPNATRPLVLVLSGGGARGVAHIGVLRVLERNNIHPDLIVGSSIGAVIGALWSSGYSADQIAATFRAFDWNTLFSDKTRRNALFLSKREYDQPGLLTLRFGPGGRPVVPTSITNGQILYTSFRHLFEDAPFQPNPSFDALRYPLRIVSCDLSTGARKVFDSGDLAIACRATLSYPLFLSPVPIDSHLYVDGGVAENLPTTVVREMSPNAFIIGVDCTAPISKQDIPDTPWEVADRVTTILQIDRNAQSLANADILIRPEVSAYSSTDFTMIDTLIAHGEQSAEQALRQLPVNNLSRHEEPASKKVTIVGSTFKPKAIQSLERPLSNRWEEYYRLADVYRKNNWINGYIKTIDHIDDRTYYTLQPPILKDIEIVGTSRTYANLMKGESGLKIGEPLHRKDLDRTVEYLYGSGMFEFIYPVREAVPGGIKLTFIVEERKLPVLRLGAGYDSHRGGSGQVQLLYDNIFGITTHGVGTFQFGEKDVSAGLRFHADRLVGRVGAADFEFSGSKTDWPSFPVSHLTAITYRRVGGTASVGQAVGRWSLLSAGVRAQRITVETSNAKSIYSIAPIFLEYTLDTEDDSPFPTSGHRLLTAWETAQVKQISDYSYTRFYLYHSSTFQLTKRFVISPQAIGGFNSSSSPRSEWYRIGGPWDFWGLATGERESRNLGMFAVTGRWDLISRLVADTYLELRGNVAVLSQTKDFQWQRGERIVGGGVGIALSTWLGPMRLVWAWAGDDIPTSRPIVSVSLGSSIPNPLGPRTIFK